jgi:hypothetical protein
MPFACAERISTRLHPYVRFWSRAGRRAGPRSGRERWLIAVRVGANKSSCATSAEFRTRLPSDQMSNYRVADPYIQAHLQGPSSRLVSPSTTHLRRAQVPRFEVPSTTGRRPST